MKRRGLRNAPRIAHLFSNRLNFRIDLRGPVSLPAARESSARTFVNCEWKQECPWSERVSVRAIGAASHLLVSQIRMYNDSRASKYALLCLYRGAIVDARREKAKYKRPVSKYRSAPLISRNKTPPVSVLSRVTHSYGDTRVPSYRSRFFSPPLESFCSAKRK